MRAPASIAHHRLLPGSQPLPMGAILTETPSSCWKGSTIADASNLELDLLTRVNEFFEHLLGWNTYTFYLGLPDPLTHQMDVAQDHERSDESQGLARPRANLELPFGEGQPAGSLNVAPAGPKAVAGHVIKAPSFAAIVEVEQRN